MKQIIFISVCVAFLQTIKTNAETCGSPVAGAILQEVTHRIEYVDGLFWSPNRLLYVNRFNPHVCHLGINGSNSCTKLEGLQEISSVYTIKNNIHKLIILADKKVILLNLNMTQNGDSMQKYTMESVTIITANPHYNLMQSITDNKRRIIIGANSESNDGNTYAKVYMVDDDYTSTELNLKNVIHKISGIVFSSDYKHLFVADSFKDVIYKYDYNDRKGTIGKHEIVFNKTEHTTFEGYLSTLGITKNNELWITMAGSSVIKLFNWKSNQFVQNIKIPASFPTSICYGDEKLDVLFIGTMKKNDEYARLEPGSGAVYAISGTGTFGFKQNELLEPKIQQTKYIHFKNAYYLSNSDLEKMALTEETLIGA